MGIAAAGIALNSGAVVAAVIAGLFLLANTMMQLVIQRYFDQRRERERERERAEDAAHRKAAADRRRTKKD